MSLNDNEMIQLLRNTKVIAVVGLSPKEDRPSFRVAAYMQKAGYRIIPVRPGGGSVLGEPCYASLEEIPKELGVDMVDVFRRSEETPPVAESAARIGAKSLWLQKEIISADSMRIAKEAGMVGVQDLCLMVEHRRLSDRL